MTGVSPRTQRLKARLRARYARETRFRWYGRAAIGVALAFLVILLGSIITQGYTAFYAHTVTLPVYRDPARIDRSYPQGANFEQIVAEQQVRRLGVPDDEQGTKASAMKALLSSELKFQAAKMVARQPSLLGQTVPIAAPLSDDAEMYLKGKITRDQPEDQRRVSNAQMDWLDRMKASGANRALRPAGSGAVHQLPAPAARQSAGRGAGAGADGPADHHHRHPLIAEGGAAVDP